MSRRLYSLFFYLCLPIIFVRLFLRARRAPAYRLRWGERLGFYSSSPKAGGILIHAVSVGETLAAVPLIKRIQADYPDLPISITTMTPTGSEQVRKNFGDELFHVYIPYDLPRAVRRLLKAIKPRLVLVMETELWPNLVDQCHRGQIPVVIANARMSQRSADSYGRVTSLVSPMLKQLSLVVAQTEQDRDRLERLGVDAEKMVVAGYIKFDIALSEQVQTEAASLKAQWTRVSARAPRKILIAASTHEGEEAIVLAAFQRLLATQPSLLLLLVPRHPERFNAVELMCAERGLRIKRRSSELPCADDTQVIIGDTMGELMSFYGTADIAFVGGSLVETGGHNLLEPAVWQLPILSGPYMFNFSEIDRLMTAAGALVKVDDEHSLAARVTELLDSPGMSGHMGEAALSVVEQNRGSLDRLYRQIIPYL